MPARKYVVIDLEATCTDRNEFPRDQTEIIEIGAVLVDGEDFEQLKEFQTFVQPILHPQLTEFCLQLTSVRQDQVDTAPRFPEAIQALGKFLEGTGAVFCSWGNYDRNQFEQDARLHRVPLPLGSRHLNLKKMFSEKLREKKGYGMAKALERVGLPLVGTHHRGIDDARNIARLLPWCLGRAEAPDPRQPGAPAYDSARWQRRAQEQRHRKG